MIQTLVKLAEKHTETIIPGFTHTQHAQPTTLAHHLLAHADAAGRDLARTGGRLREGQSEPSGCGGLCLHRL